METKKAYTCGVNWQHDLCEDNAKHVEFFGSIQALKKDRTCWKECGIVEIEMKVTKWVEEPQDLFKNCQEE